MPTIALHDFYQTLEQTRQRTGCLEHSYHLLAYVAPQPATHSISDQFERFRQDSVLRHICLQAGKGLHCGVASPFFGTFQRTRVDMSTLPTDTTIFGEPGEYSVVRSQQAFNVLFRHFCYALGNDLSLPRGAFYAGSSCVAALTVPVGTSEARLAQLEQRVQRKQQEALMQRAIAQKFPGKETLAAAIMSFARDALTLHGFNKAVEEILAETRGGP